MASPATVSRAGMVYLDVTKLGWEPFARSWLSNVDQLDNAGRTHLWSLFEQHVARLLEFKKHECVEPVQITDFNAVRSLCNLFKCLTTKGTYYNVSLYDSVYLGHARWFGVMSDVIPHQQLQSM